jgi:heme oxygenase
LIAGSNLHNESARPVTAAATDCDVLAALRTATAERHGAIDGSMPLSRRNPTMDDYVEHLLLMRAWLRPLEAWLEGSDVRPDGKPAGVLQTSLIDADLDEMGLQHLAEQEELRTHRWPARAHVSYKWGARYVIEGSRLGAAVLYRRLSYALRPHKLRYLYGGDGIARAHWPIFLRDLRASVRAPSDVEQACRGACDSFDALLALRPVESRVFPLAIEHS